MECNDGPNRVVHVSDTETVSKTQKVDGCSSQSAENSLRQDSVAPLGQDSNDQNEISGNQGKPFRSPGTSIPFSHPPHHSFWNTNTQPPSPPPSSGEQPSLLYFYEAQMRNHAAAYANAAASAAMVSAQIAADMAQASNTTMPRNSNIPHMLPSPTCHPIFPMPVIQSPYGQTQPFYDQSIRPVSEVATYNNLDANSSLGEDSSSWDYGQRRRKRQQRMPPDKGQQLLKEAPRESQISSSSEKRGRRRRRFRNDASNYAEAQQYENQNRRRNRKMALASSSSDGGSTHYVSKKKQRQPSDESLLGKSGVSALYEWCGKRKTRLTFTLEENRPRLAVEDFEMTVSIDGTEWGKGRGKNKSGAKQEAARRALQALVPGVLFEEGGTLVQLPKQTKSRYKDQIQPTATAASLEDLAPNLAKRLAIVHTNEDDYDEAELCNRNSRSTSEAKRRHNLSHFRVSTTSTSEEEDENDYLSSRGASVCSALLHAMVQIDDRIPVSPSYTYQVSTVSASSKSSAQLKRKADGPLATPIVIHRGNFTCTATMRVQVKASKPRQPTFEILQANGVGGTKREARHIASAQLLAKLFPDCEGMVAVKQAAESARERYAASKALKQQSKRDMVFANAVSSNRMSRERNGEEQRGIFFAVKSSRSPPLPTEVEKHLLNAFWASKSAGDGFLRGAKIGGGDDSDLVRQNSRQKQLDDAITSALQKLNEHDEDGRSLPDELTVDDVGRTVLRRASQEDHIWITKLLETERSPLSPVSVFLKYQNTHDNQGSDCSSPNHPLWSSSTIVLLLCRAIAPYDDPPLGCAVLTLGFSMERGRTLRIAQIANKSHLPLERFTEVLHTFANHFCCALETASTIDSKASIILQQDDLTEIFNSHISIPEGFFNTYAKDSLSFEPQEPLIHSTLQSVKEEDFDENDSSCPESGAEKRNPKKAQEKKPCKRSRVQ